MQTTVTSETTENFNYNKITTTTTKEKKKKKARSYWPFQRGVGGVCLNTGVKKYK